LEKGLSLKSMLETYFISYYTSTYLVYLNMLLIVAVTDKKTKIMKAYSVSVQNILRLFPHKAR